MSSLNQVVAGIAIGLAIAAIGIVASEAGLLDSFFQFFRKAPHLVLIPVGLALALVFRSTKGKSKK